LALHKHKYHYKLGQRLKRCKTEVLLALCRTTIVTSLLILLSFACLSLIPKHTFAISKTWDGGCGADINWSCANNWSDNAVPASGDTVTFDNTSDNNSTIDALFNATETITTININSGYDGTITMATTLHVSTSFSQAAGTFTAANQTLDVNGTFVTSGTSSFTASSGSMTVSSTFTLGASTTFSANGGTLTFDGSTSATLTCNSKTFNLVTFANTGNFTKTIASSCSLPLGNNPTVGGDANADISNGGVLSGTGTLTIGTAATTNLFTLSGTSSLSGFSGLNAGAMTVSATNTHNYSSYSTFVVNGAFSQNGSGTLTVPNGADFNGTFALGASSNAVFNAPAGTVTFASAFTSNTGTTFNPNGGTVTFDGAGSGAITCSGTISFNLVTFTHTASAKTINSGCTIPLGSNPTIGTDSAADLTVSGTISGSGTLTIGTLGTGNLLTLNNTASLSGFSGLQTGDLTVSGPTINFGSYTTFSLSDAYSQTGGTITVPDNADFNGSFTMVAAGSGTFNAPSGTAKFASTFTINSGNTFNANGGTIEFDGGVATLSCANATFNLVTFTHSGGAKTVSSDCSMPLGNNPSVGLNVVTGGDITLSGTLSGTGTLTLGPAASQTNDLTINSGGVLSGFSGIVVNGSYTQAGATIDMGSYLPATFNRHFTLSSGIFTAPTGTMSVYRDFSISSGTFNANSGTLNLTGDSAGTISCNNASFNLATFTHTSGTKTVNSNCSFPLGNNPAVGSGGSVTLTGTFSGSGTLLSSGMTLNSGYTLSGFSGLQTITGKNLAIGGAAPANFGSYSVFDINGDLTVNAGANFTAPTGTMNVASSFNLVSTSTFNANGGTLNFDSDGGSADDGTLTCSSNVFNVVTFTHASGTKSVASDCSLPLGANPAAGAGGSITLNGILSGSGTLTTTGTFMQNTGSSLSGFTGLNAASYTANGTFDFGSYNTFDVDSNFTIAFGADFTATTGNMTVGRDFTIDSGTFHHNNGTVILDGTAQFISGTTFNNLSKIAGSSAELTLAQSELLTILGSLTFNGASPSALLTLKSTTPGTFWQIDPRGAVSAQYLSVSDSQNLGATITACGSTDGGHNSGWVFTSTCGSSAGGSGGEGSSTSSTSSLTSYSSGSSGSQAENAPSPFLEKATEAPKKISTAIPELKKIIEQKNKPWILIIGGGIFGLIFLVLLIAFLKRHATQEAPIVGETVVAPERKDPPQNLIM
jgi:fibronectin-binding autotransporter adhesin